MLWTLTRKEALTHLLSLRFHLSVLLIVGLMAGGAVIFRGDYERDMSDYNGALAARQKALAHACESSVALYAVYSFLDQGLMSRPAELGFIAEGHQRDLPNVIETNAFRLQKLSVQQRGNPMMQPFEALDWTLIVTVVLSFAALVLTFDGFAGEKEDGTLRLVLSNSVPRWMLVVSKLLGAWAVLMAGLLVGGIIQLLILLPGGWLTLEGASVARLAAAFGLSSLYVAVFVLLGLLISARHASSAAALVVALLAWAVLAVVIPRSTVLLAHAIERVERQGEVATAAAHARDAAYDEYRRLHPDSTDWVSGHWSPGESLNMALTMWRAWQQPYDAWRTAQLHQVERARRWSYVSPAALLSAGLERISGGGLSGYTQFLSAAQSYRETMAQGLVARYPLDGANGYGMDQQLFRKVQAVKVSPAELPTFHPRTESAGAAIASTGGIAGTLVVLSLLLLLAASVAAGKYDVR